MTYAQLKRKVDAQFLAAMREDDAQAEVLQDELRKAGAFPVYLGERTDPMDALARNLGGKLRGTVHLYHNEEHDETAVWVCPVKKGGR